MSAAARLRSHLLAALAEVDLIVAEKVVSEDELNDLILKVDQLEIEARRMRIKADDDQTE